MTTVAEYALTPLQWGHRLSAMDRRNDHRCRVRPNTASMGPPPFGDGNDGRQDQGKGLHPPSMGPPPFSDGNLVLLLNLDTLGVPSMGPSPFSDGNDYLGELPVRSPPHPSMGPPPFSDGNLVLLLNLDTLGVPSMGPPPFSDGNLVLLLNLDTLERTFNGAIAFQRWKRLSWGTPGPQPAASFNGATAFQRWKPHDLGIVFDQDAALQWGHRLSAMETALCGSPPSWIHEKAVFSTRIGYRINGRASVAQLGFATP